ncbi:MAG: hypothetical protein K0Q49_1285 [Haloplasmataceae bacterium]|jgi:hypothetical protein|nr:hypothetical protein [Haloplasmataceae bacterium]
MDIKIQLYHFIDQLNLINHNFNLLYNDDCESLLLEDSIVNFFVDYKTELSDFLKDLNNDRYSELIDQIVIYSVDDLIKTITRINQFVDIDHTLKAKLYHIYYQFISILIEKMFARTIHIDWLTHQVKQHQAELKVILQEIDELAIYRNEPQNSEDVPCFQYSAKLQLGLMGIDIKSLNGPVIDIGCGEYAYLVNYLVKLGKDIVGIDRSVSNGPHTINTSWFDFDFGEDKWSSIISHQSFTNHFKRQHYKTNGSYIEYIKLYLNILKSLKPKGSFYYTPDLPFIEQFLDSDKYKVERLPIENLGFYSVKITKL